MDIESKLANYLKNNLSENTEYKILKKISVTYESLKKSMGIIEKELNKSDNKEVNQIKSDLNKILSDFKDVHDRWNKVL